MDKAQVLDVAKKSQSAASQLEEIKEAPTEVEESNVLDVVLDDYIKQEAIQEQEKQAERKVHYYSELVKIDDENYLIKNEDPLGKDLEIEVDKDEEDEYEESIDFDGFPPDISVQFSNMFSMKQQFRDPHQCLYLLVESFKSARKGMRSAEELA